MTKKRSGDRVVNRTPDGSGPMFDRIAPRYDRLNRLLSLGLDARWRSALVRALGPLGAGDEVLDVATGTGDVAFVIARHAPSAVRIVGVDPSPGMLAIARDKAQAAEDRARRIRFVAGDAQQLAFEDGRFAASCIAFGIRNVPDRARGLAELTRVVRPGGRVAVLELSEPRHGVLSRFARGYLHHVVPRIGGWLSGAREYRYLQSSVAAFPSPAAFTAMMRAAGLEHVVVQHLFPGVAQLFVGRRPA